MTIKKLLPSLLLALTLLAPNHPSMAQDVRETLDNDVLTQMQNEGWRIVKNGVLQRELRAGEIESFVFGSEGFTWKLQDLRARLHKLLVELKAHPTPELRKAVAGYRQEIASTQKMIQRALAAEALGETGIDDKVSCAINFAYAATASYGTSAQGTWGNASANFTGNCGFTGEVYATAYSKVTVNGAPTTKTVTDGPRSGANVSASAYASLNGGATCESSSYASMTSGSLNPSSYSMSASNFVCPWVSNPVVSINGVGYIYVYACTSTTWTASVSGGTSPYTYQWTWNGANVGTGSSYTRSICPGVGYSYTTNSLGLTVTDSGSRTGSASKSVDVEKEGSGGTCAAAVCP